MSRMPDNDDTIQMLTWAFTYQTTLYELEMAFQANQSDYIELLSDLRVDMVNIRRCQQWCAEHLDEDDRAAMMCSKLAGVGGTLLEMELSRQESIRWREAGLAGARKTQLVEDEIGHINYLSYAHFVNNNIETALTLADEAVELSRQHTDHFGYATALQHRGMFYSRLGRESEAIAVLGEAISEHERTENIHAKTTCLGALAVCYSRLNEPQKAVDLYAEAIAVETDRGAIGTYLCNMAGELIDINQLVKARSCLDQAQKIADETGDLTLKGLILVQTAQTHIANQDSETAGKVVALLKDALVSFRKKGESYHEHDVLRFLTQVYNNVLDDSEEPLTYNQLVAALRGLIETLNSLAQHPEVIEACNRLFASAEQYGDLAGQLEALVMKGHSQVLLQHHDQAIVSHLNAIDVLARIRLQEKDSDVNIKAGAELYLSLGQAYRQTNQADRAIESYEIAEKISARLPDDEMRYRAIGNIGLVYADTGHYDEAIARLARVFSHYEDQRDYRLSGHAKFNLAYAYYCKGDLDEAKVLGDEAMRYLTIINDPGREQVRSQMESWGKQ